MLCTAFWVPSRAIHTIRCYPHPESFSGLNALHACFFRRSCWRACRSGRLSIFWVSSRTLVLCACFITECGMPGIRKSMSVSTIIVCSWLKLAWSITGLSILSRNVLSPTLIVSLSWTERVWELSDTFSVCISWTSLLVLPCVFSTLGCLLSSDERARITLVSITGISVRSKEVGSSQKELTSIFWERDVFLPSCTVLVSSLTTDFPFSSQFGFGVGKSASIGNVQMTAQLLHVERNLNLILSSIRVSMRSLTEIEETCKLFQLRLYQIPS